MLLVSPTPFSLCCALLLCLPLACFVFTSISSSTTPPPPPLPIPIDDDSLFRLASYSSPSSNAPKRIAFMFLTTTSPLPFAPLWELFFQNHHHLFNIYIHADLHLNSSSFNFSGLFSNRVIHSKPTQRYTPTLISAARRLLAHALLHDPTNAMFALLSPSCIPLHSFNFTYHTLIHKNNNKSFIEILKDEPGSFHRWAARGDHVMDPDVPFQHFRVGSQFFVLTRTHAKLVVSDRRVWMRFNQPCIRTDVCYPEEHYFPTLMSMRDPSGCVPATLTHVDWSGTTDGHPRTYLPSQVGPHLIKSLRRTIPRYGYPYPYPPHHHPHPFLFARKFPPHSLHQLLNMSKDVIFND